MIHPKIKNTFKYFLTTFTVVFLISCSGPTFDEGMTEIENGEVWDGYDSKRLDYCRVEQLSMFLEKTQNCSTLEMSEMKETYKGKYITFKGFSLGNYDENLIPQEDGGYIYKNLWIQNRLEHTEVIYSQTPPVRWYKIKNLYVKDKKIVDFLFKESNKDTGSVFEKELVPEPRTVITFKGLIHEVNPEQKENLEDRTTVIQRGIIIDPSFE